ncbi:endonuclease/exonuclease/phosphatase family protein [Bacillus sp. V3B]|uniref:endonuclease/exonuclease/phosphatase family protein n=1 Tax=Bacillus sp. V3B TaxID=2804915 RepID=UPI0021093BC7|nr:endonuclease/exonuclease/phosphatase family protein [Bacillus sp. V3B]
MKIKVMTFNIHHGKGIDKQSDLYRIAEVIDKCNPDIIGLNEVDQHFSRRSLYEDQTSWIANQLKMDHAFSPSISIKSKHLIEKRQYGNALLSRYPIITKKIHLFKNRSGINEGRSLIEATIQINKQLYIVMVTHLSLNLFLHKKQTDFIVNQSQKYSHPTIIMGDCNMRPGSKGWRKLTDAFQDVWNIGGNGTGYTHPSLRPRRRLDYIFVSRNLKVVEADVVTKISKASDHLPLTATLQYDSKR